MLPASVPELRQQNKGNTTIMGTPFPVRAHVMRDTLVEMIPNERKLKVVDEFHSISHVNFNYWGLFGTMNQEHDDFQWVIACSVNHSGTLVNMYSGIWFPGFRNTCSFHAESLKVITGGKYRTEAEIALFVNERLDDLQKFYLLDFERMNHYKNKVLTRAQANDLICTMIEQEVFAGRIAAEFIELWHKQAHEYTKPRTVWSLFCEVSWVLNRLLPYHMIERTINARVFFDTIFRFKPRASIWKQETFA